MRWYEYLIGHKQRMTVIQLRLAEIKRQQARVELALLLHKEVLREYGLEYQRKLVAIVEIVRDTKSVTIINYLDI